MVTKTIIVALLLLGLIAAFTAGRLTAPPPVFEPGTVLQDDPLDEAWQDFITSLQQTRELFRSSEFFVDDQERAEAYRSILYGLSNAIKVAALSDPEHPRFMRAVDWSGKRGLENPDNNYYTAQIRDDAEYRIIGTRGSSRSMILQLVVGVPGVRGAGSSTNISVLYDQDMVFEDDGSFELIVSRQQPPAGVNWLPNGDGAQTLLVRYTHSDWSAERPGQLRIERIGGEGEHSTPLSPVRMANNLRELSVNLFDASATWFSFANRIWSLSERNDVSAPRATEGGLVGQYSAFGSYELDNDQALVISVAPSAASYQSIQLGNLWFTSLDYETHTSSLSLDQMFCSGDDRCYAVVSHRDPGIQNWLDTEGHRRGLIFLRWQGLKMALPESLHPQAELVEFSRLRELLPDDVTEFSAEQRRSQIQRRRANVQERFNG